MKETTLNQLNGVGVLLRFITPLMIGLLMAMVHQDSQARRDLQQDILGIKTSLDNHVTALMKEQTAIRERLGRIEGILSDGSKLKR